MSALLAQVLRKLLLSFVCAVVGLACWGLAGTEGLTSVASVSSVADVYPLGLVVAPELPYHLVVWQVLADVVVGTRHIGTDKVHSLASHMLAGGATPDGSVEGLGAVSAGYSDRCAERLAQGV